LFLQDQDDDDEFDYEGETGTIVVQALPKPPPPQPELPDTQVDDDAEAIDQQRIEAEQKAIAEAAKEADTQHIQEEKDARAAAELARVRAAAATIDVDVSANTPTEPSGTKAVQQWEHVSQGAPTITDGEQPGDATKAGYKKEKVAISFQEAVMWFAAVDISQELTDIVTTDDSHLGFFGKMFSCFTTTSLDSTLVVERNRAFAYGRMRWKEGETVHLRMLQTIFLRLTQTKLHVPRKGSHWEDIGCQGSDPSTDIRVPGTGMLGPLQVIWLLSNHGDIARWIHRVSDKGSDNMRKFPFFVTASRFTRTAVEAMRQGHLNSLFNRAGKDGILDVLGKIFAATFWTFAKLWEEQCLDIHKFDETAKDLDRKAKADPEGTIASFERAALRFKEAISGNGTDSGPLSFLNMEDKQSF